MTYCAVSLRWGVEASLHSISASAATECLQVCYISILVSIQGLVLAYDRELFLGCTQSKLSCGALFGDRSVSRKRDPTVHRSMGPVRTEDLSKALEEDMDAMRDVFSDLYSREETKSSVKFRHSPTLIWRKIRGAASYILRRICRYFVTCHTKFVTCLT